MLTLFVFIYLFILRIISGSAPIKKEESNVLESKEPYETLKFDFNFESLSLVLYNSDPTLVCIE